jgi:tripartite-type tricarboxylate transporter receptor subunit TctC
VVTQVAGGHTDIGVVALGSAKSQIDGGNARFIAAFGSRRAPGYEDVPTLKEVGYDVSFVSAQVVLGPPKMPRNISEKLINAFKVASDDPEYQKFVTERNGIPFVLSPDEVVKFLDEQTKTCRSVMTKAGILKSN